MLACSFTGYRPSKLPFILDKNSEYYLNLYNAIKDEICRLVDCGVTCFLTGMAQGIDLMCGEIILELKQIFDIHLFCVIPCEGQCYGWCEDDKQRYQKLLYGASDIIYTSKEYFKGCMMKRNRYLVDNAEYILAVYDGKQGGTGATIDYAKKKHRTIIIINPTTYTRVELIHDDEGGLYV